MVVHAQIVPRKIRTSLDGVMEHLKGLPNRLRQYAAFEHVQTTVKNYLKGNALVCVFHCMYIAISIDMDLSLLNKIPIGGGAEE